MEQIIREKLNLLNPSSLKIVDESYKHKGHLPSSSDNGTHFKLEITSEVFLNKSKLERHRIIYNLLSQELVNNIHALSIKASTPEEL